MTDRTFHKRFTMPAKCGVIVFACVAGYFFWIKAAIVGILLAIVIVGMIERILNTTYTFRRVKPIDRDEEMDFLIIDEGRFSRRRQVALADVKGCERMRMLLGLEHCIVIDYGDGQVVSVQPDNEEGFVREIKNRTKEIDNN